MASEDQAGLLREFEAGWMLRPTVEKPVWHQSLRLRAGERVEPEVFLEIVHEYMRRMGMDGVAFQYAVVMHDDPDGQHVHIVANRICQLPDVTGKPLWWGRNENFNSSGIIRELERDFGLIEDPSAANYLRTYTKDGELRYILDKRPEESRPSQGELRKHERQEAARAAKAAKEGRPFHPQAPFKERLQAHIRRARRAGEREGLAGFLRVAEQSGLQVRFAFTTKGGVREIQGISFGYEGQGRAGKDLGTTYSWPSIAEKVGFDASRDMPLLEVRTAKAHAAHAAAGLALVPGTTLTMPAPPVTGEPIAVRGVDVTPVAPAQQRATVGSARPSTELSSVHGGAQLDTSASGSLEERARAALDRGDGAEAQRLFSEAAIAKHEALARYLAAMHAVEEQRKAAELAAHQSAAPAVDHKAQAQRIAALTATLFRNLGGRAAIPSHEAPQHLGRPALLPGTGPGLATAGRHARTLGSLGSLDGVRALPDGGLVHRGPAQRAGGDAEAGVLLHGPASPDLAAGNGTPPDGLRDAAQGAAPGRGAGGGLTSPVLGGDALGAAASEPVKPTPDARQAALQPFQAYRDQLVANRRQSLQRDVSQVDHLTRSYVEGMRQRSGVPGGASDRDLDIQFLKAMAAASRDVERARRVLVLWSPGAVPSALELQRRAMRAKAAGQPHLSDSDERIEVYLAEVAHELSMPAGEKTKPSGESTQKTPQPGVSTSTQKRPLTPSKPRRRTP